MVIPYLTESYGSSADPAEEALPLCTLKSFPYQVRVKYCGFYFYFYFFLTEETNDSLIGIEISFLMQCPFNAL